MFLEKLKRKSALKLLKKALNAHENSKLSKESSKIRSLGCIVNFDEFNHTEVFQELAEQIGLKSHEYKIIGFSEKGLMGTGFNVPVFTDKDLGWNGQIKNSDINEYLGREYDLLINYYQHAPVILKLVSAKTKSQTKIGLLDSNQDLNDIVFQISPDSFSKFREEIIKYLKILKKI
ncbi:DUF6913 domain-containing protein [Ascidiimonas sp. W6]|uniref:DUF6913 domain-containing protein n=1 Tax=Ascidiimonas meishanensis TaxID=3128903 RepID=UPI0030EF7CF8